MLQSLNHGHLFSFLLLVPGLKLQPARTKRDTAHLHIHINISRERCFHVLLVLSHKPVLNYSLHDVIGGQIVATVQDAENTSLLRLLQRETMGKKWVFMEERWIIGDFTHGIRVCPVCIRKHFGFPMTHQIYLQPEKIDMNQGFFFPFKVN